MQQPTKIQILQMIAMINDGYDSNYKECLDCLFQYFIQKIIDQKEIIPLSHFKLYLSNKLTESGYTLTEYNKNNLKSILESKFSDNAFFIKNKSNKIIIASKSYTVNELLEKIFDLNDKT